MKNKLANQLLFYSYCFLMVSFFLPLKINSIALILTGLISLFFIKPLILIHKRKPIIILFWLFFGLLLIGITYTENLAEGWSIIERHFSLLFIPFFAPSFTVLTRSQQKKVFNLFILAISISSLYCLGYAMVDYIKTGSVYIPGYSGFPIYNKFMHHRLVSPIGMHAIFFSLYLSFAFIILLNRFILQFKDLKLRVKIGYILVLLFYLVFLILLKSSLFALALPIAIISLFTFHYSSEIVSSTKFKLISVILLLSIGTYSLYGIKTKIRDFSTDFQFNDPQINSLKIRLGIWICSWETIQKDWILGHGTGDAQDKLMQTYHEKNFVIGKKDKFNAHNMYLQYWMSNGIFTVSLFCLLLLFFISFFLRNKQIVAFLTIFLFAMFSLTESTMLKQNGIVFFVLFTSIFFFNKKTIRKI